MITSSLGSPAGAPTASAGPSSPASPSAAQTAAPSSSAADGPDSTFKGELQRLTARGIDVRCVDIGDAEVNLASARQKVTLKQGIDQPLAKKIVKLIKDSGGKVQAQIQGDQLRVTGKKRDDLQAAIALLRAGELEMPLQFENFRD